MRFVLKSCLLSLLLLAVAASAYADVKLPPPQTEGGMGLFEALKKRASAAGGDFPVAPLELEELSTILWAATGLNRGEKGWTVPMSKGLEPYCKIYAAQDEGIFLYDWRTHSLIEISQENIRAKVGSQNFVKTAPCILIVVADGKALSDNFNEKDSAEFAAVAAGAMTQDIYLAAAAFEIGTRYIHSMNLEEIHRALSLPEEDYPLCLMMLG
ncbi:MAG: nitroreductase family protein, partial [Synergistaceae bacterium]|nr:nitroreductase family protein [Synergistaceae bacterium]